ncbi:MULTISPECIES: hypothetical protein [unclassified Brevundimonas]|jgi:hypothetical protein|uniref:hypothetical protein n=1 Tax=unclassified Brevundimonas TaxID=2622653 RepID=UPI000C3AF36B|nr:MULTISPECIES: hypothetical protein [unclassified Brevundimonas]MAL87325.1 hypothetical protein [Brevundimonas sp.]HAJ02462.1 hypothetical protein [Brevundimonas sp.]|tara:strand:+ start:37310 stop:37696 length:387 start_codon:yes stop_codon:yes gene_type:complete
MTPLDNTPDAQDQSETFDETHIDDEGEGDILPDQADPVLDVTQREGDAGEEDDDADEIQTLQRIDPDGRVDPRSDEIELVYDGLMRNRRGAQASAAHWEARRLDDDDIEALGYGPEDDTPPSTDRTPA